MNPINSTFVYAKREKLSFCIGTVGLFHISRVVVRLYSFGRIISCHELALELYLS